MTTISNVTFTKGEGPPPELQTVLNVRGMGVPFEATNFRSSTRGRAKIYSQRDYKRTGRKTFINRNK